MAQSTTIRQSLSDPTLLPLRGIRVADFSWVVAAPLATQYLAIHGADVIRIESRNRPDVIRKGQPFPTEDMGPDGTAYFANFNQGKRGITLNLRDPRAIDLAKRLIATCDVVSENFTPGTMARLGLAYADLRRVNPTVIMLSMSLAGQTGPDRGNKGFGTVIQGSAGITHFTGWPDRDPVGTGVAYTDFFAAHVAAFAVLAALEHRRRTGEGQHIDMSQQEASMDGLDAALLAALANGDAATRAGNRHPAAAPHGVYPCRPDDDYPDDDDRWIAIAVMHDRHWAALRAAMGNPAWAADARFGTLLGRKAHEDELDAPIAAWTRTHTARAAERLLSAAGVPAGVASSARDLHDDPQLAFRQHYVDTHHPVLGAFPFDAQPYRINRLRPQPPRPSPRLGDDNAAVYQALLGVTVAEYRELEAGGVFT